MPVNMPTHGHGHGYSDLNFLIPELVSGVQFSKGPYFADQGDFATAGAGEHQLHEQPRRVRSCASAAAARASAGRWPPRRRAAGTGTLLGALEVQHNDGPWDEPDDFRKVNGVVRYSQGDALNGFSITGMGYRGTWDSTDQIPARAIADGRIDRFGTIDATDGGDSYRYSGSFDWQRTRNNASTKVSAFGVAYDLNLFSNFTYFLDDPGQRRSVPAGRSPLRVGREGHPSTARAVGRARGAEHRRRAAAQRRHRQRRALPHAWRARPLETIREDARQADERRRFRAERDAVDAVAAHARRRARRRLSLRRRCR